MAQCHRTVRPGRTPTLRLCIPILRYGCLAQKGESTAESSAPVLFPAIAREPEGSSGRARQAPGAHFFSHAHVAKLSFEGRVGGEQKGTG